MYSHEDRIKAVKLYIKYDFSLADTVQKLGYPDRSMLVEWYKEYQETGDLHIKFVKYPKYSSDQMKVAVNYYLEHGRNITRTVRAFGTLQGKLLEAGLTKWLQGNEKFA